jgi:23S rRNA (guanosine2251-2'-O)-methyltransferase
MISNREIVVVLDNVRSALNVGAIFRTCDGAGVKKLILGGITPFPPHKKLVKTALGAEEFVTWEHSKDLTETIKKYKKEGFCVYSIEQNPSSINHTGENYSDKVLLIFGNEILGVNSELLKLSDRIIEIPMLGKKNSLNVATTVGIIVYHLRFN